jgi:hypothetical protein
MRRLLSALFSALFFAMALPIAAQDAAPIGAALPAPVVGAWSGEWQSTRHPTFYGSMDIEIDVKADQVVGRAKAGIRGSCSNQWQKLTGVLKDGKVFASYNLGGACGNVDVILSVDPDGIAMTGTWSSEYPSYGTYKLRKTTTAVRSN